MKIQVLPKAQKDFKKLSQFVQGKISKSIDSLEADPFPHGYTKLTNQPGYRIRVGEFRVLYIIDFKNKILFIVKIAHRKDAY